MSIDTVTFTGVKTRDIIVTVEAWVWLILVIAVILVIAAANRLKKRRTWKSLPVNESPKGEDDPR